MLSPYSPAIHIKKLSPLLTYEPPDSKRHMGGKIFCTDLYKKAR